LFTTKDTKSTKDNYFIRVHPCLSVVNLQLLEPDHPAPLEAIRLTALDIVFGNPRPETQDGHPISPLAKRAAVPRFPVGVAADQHQAAATVAVDVAERQLQAAAQRPPTSFL